VLQDNAYAPYGENYAVQGPTYPDYSFTGQHSDVSNLLDFVFREYHLSQGRWMSPDPLGGDVTNPQSLNRYAYVGNNPLSFIDPLGLGPCDRSNPPPFCSRGEAHVNDAISRLEHFSDQEAALMCITEGSAFCDFGAGGFSLSVGLGGLTGPPGGPSGPLSNDFGANLPPPRPHGGLPCDFGACGGGVPGSGFAEATELGAELGTAVEPGIGTVVGIVVGVAIDGYLAYRLWKNMHKVAPWSGKYPGNDPTKAPEPGWIWKGNGPVGSPQGNWVNPDTGESLHPDLNHLDPIPPHWDWKDPNGDSWRIFPDSTAVPKH